jgi:hypothetical protein
MVSSSWFVSTDIVLEGKTCLTHCQDGTPHSIQILRTSQRWVDIATSKATLKAFPSLNNLHVVWVLSFLYVSSSHSEFTVGFEGKQCTRIWPSDTSRLWLWSILICRIELCYYCVCLLGHFKVTGTGRVIIGKNLISDLFTQQLSVLQLTLERLTLQWTIFQDAALNHTVNTLCLHCKTNRLMSYREIIIIYSAIHTKHYTQCQCNIVFLSVTPGGM